MAKWNKQELIKANINSSMTVYEIDAKVRRNGLKKAYELRMMKIWL